MSILNNEHSNIVDKVELTKKNVDLVWMIIFSVDKHYFSLFPIVSAQNTHKTMVMVSKI